MAKEVRADEEVLVDLTGYNPTIPYKDIVENMIPKINYYVVFDLHEEYAYKREVVPLPSETIPQAIHRMFDEWLPEELDERWSVFGYRWESEDVDLYNQWSSETEYVDAEEDFPVAPLSVRGVTEYTFKVDVLYEAPEIYFDDLIVPAELEPVILGGEIRNPKSWDAAQVMNKKIPESDKAWPDVWNYKPMQDKPMDFWAMQQELQNYVIKIYWDGDMYRTLYSINQNPFDFLEHAMYTSDLDLERESVYNFVIEVARQ